MLTNENINFLNKIINLYEIKISNDKFATPKQKNDMAKLVVICKKILQNIDLSLEEIEFIYEKNEKIETTYKDANKQNRRLWLLRDVKKDYQKMYKYSDDEITDNLEEYKKNPTKYKCYVGNIVLNNVEDLILPEHLVGSLNINVKNKLPKLPRIIEKHLIINELKFPIGLIPPEKVGGNIEYRGLKTSKGLQLPKYIGGNLMLDNVIYFEDFSFPNQIGGNIYFKLMSYENIDVKSIPLPLTYKIYFHDKVLTPDNIKNIKSK